MFSGVVQAMGRVRRLGRGAGGVVLVVEARDFPVDALASGESVAVDGVCLTVTATSGATFSADVVPETLSRTTLGAARPGTRVNLERSLRLGDLVSGHLLQGHVDATARVEEVRQEGGDHRVRVDLVPEIAPFVASKGSVALNGVSLTVTSVERETFEVALIPETLSRTNLGRARRGTRLNVEVDLVARYLERLMQHARGTAACGAPAPAKGMGSAKGGR